MYTGPRAERHECYCQDLVSRQDIDHDDGQSRTELLVAANDRLLEGLIRAHGEAARAREIESLIANVARPLTARILARYPRAVGRDDGEDIASTVSLRLLRKLRAVLESEEDAVRQLEEYVAALAYNAINDHLRRRYPERSRLKNRVRYVLTHDSRLATWSSPAGPAAGLAVWRGSTDVAASMPIAPPAVTRRMLDRQRPADAVAEMLRAAGGPVLVDTLIDTAAALWQITDAPLVDLDQADAATETVALRIETRDFLRVLWREIEVLPAPQRKALLLNLRDAETLNVMALFALTRTATLGQLAGALEMSIDALAAVWNDLPMDDQRIADLLKLSRQQVINLRKSARARLARRVLQRKR